MVSADNKLGATSIQCGPDSSQANIRAFIVHQIVAIAAREHEACLFCFIVPLDNSFEFGISGLEKG